MNNLGLWCNEQLRVAMQWTTLGYQCNYSRLWMQWIVLLWGEPKGDHDPQLQWQTTKNDD